MRRLAFVLLATLIVGVSAAGPAHGGYWSLLHYPHHLPHGRPHHFHHHGVVPLAAGQPGQPVQPLSVAQVFHGLQLGHQLLSPLFNHPGAAPAPAADPKVSAATTAEITQTGTAVDKSVDNVNALLKLVRAGDKRLEKTLVDVAKTGAAPTPTGSAPAGTAPTPGPGAALPPPKPTG